MYVTTDETGRITCTSECGDPGEDATFDFPEGFDFEAQTDYRIVDGELVHDPRQETAAEAIARLRAELASTDYVPVKMAEYMVSGEELPEEEAARYADIIKSRKEIREEISRLEVTTDGAPSAGE